jgi:hypothetical protein
MEVNMAKLGYPPHTKPSRQPNTLEEGIHEIAYLHAVEAAERRRLGILLKIYNATYEHIHRLERERLSLEKVYIPVAVVKPSRADSVQKIAPKSREDILASWEGKSQDQIDKMIAELEALG